MQLLQPAPPRKPDTTRGGTLRFQAQYLRKIRVPRPGTIERAVASDLTDAFERRDPEAATSAALRAYALDADAKLREALALEASDAESMQDCAGIGG
jgi:hypothetical protein